MSSMIGLFLRGAAYAPIVDDKDFDLPHPPLEDGDDREKDFGMSDFWVGMGDVENLDVFDKGPIKYDGFPALARHAYNKPDNSPLEFLSNVTFEVMTDRMGELGFDIVVINKPIAEGSPVKTIIDRVIWRISRGNDVKKETLAYFVATSQNILFRDTFYSAERWVHGSAEIPFLTVRVGVTEKEEEEGTCPRYKPLLFFSDLLESEKAYLNLPSFESKINGDNMLLRGTEQWFQSRLIDNLPTGDHLKRYMHLMKTKFIERNKADPSTLTRGGADVGYFMVENLAKETPSKPVRRYYDVDTDPILTIALMMFTSCFTIIYTNNEGENKVSVDMDAHGELGSVSKAYNIVPPGMTIDIGFPGYSVYYPDILYLNNDPEFEETYNTKNENVRNGKSIVASGQAYLEVELGEPSFISLIPQATEYSSIYLLLWSTRFMNAMYDLMYPERPRSEEEPDIRIERNRTLGQYVRLIKEGLFWYDAHHLRALSCQKHKADSLVQRAFNIYWMNFERGFMAKQNEHRVSGTPKKNSEEKGESEGFLASLKTPAAIDDLLRQILDDYMPPEFQIPPELVSENNLDLSKGVRFSDLTAIITETFMRTHLNIDIPKIFEGISKLRSQVDDKTQQNMSRTKLAYTTKKILTKPSLRKSVIYVLSVISYSDTIKSHIREGDTHTFKNPKYVIPGGDDKVHPGDDENTLYKRTNFTLAELYEAVVDVLGLHEYAYLYRKRLPEKKSLAELEKEKNSQPGGATAGAAGPPGYSSVAAIAASLLVVAASAFVGALRL